MISFVVECEEKSERHRFSNLTERGVRFYIRAVLEGPQHYSLVRVDWPKKGAMCSHSRTLMRTP